MTTRRTRAYAFAAKDPPGEIQLWSVGPNPTDYGTHHWTERSVREVMAAYEARGNPLQVDIEHNGSPEERERRQADAPPPTGGYARLEVRNGAPWLVFDWSAYAIEQIRTRQRLFLSPEYEVDPDTGEIVRLIRISLVADPGTHNARMLASAARRRLRAGTGRNEGMDLKLILAALRAALAAEPEAAKEAIAKLVSELEGMLGDEAAEPAAEDEGTAVEANDGTPEEDKDKLPTTRAKASRAAAEEASVDLAVRLARVESSIQQLAVTRLVEEFNDRFTASTRAWALKQPLATVESYIKAAGKQELRAPTTATATRGEAQGEPSKTAADEEVDAAVDRALGFRRPAKGPIGLAAKPVGGIYRLNAPTAAQIRAARASGAGARQGE